MRPTVTGCSTCCSTAIILIGSTLVGGCVKGNSQPEGHPSDAVDLGDYRWKHRIVLVFAKSEERAEFRDFMGAWSREQEGVKDRDLIIFHALIEGKSEGPSGILTPAQADSLRRKYATAGEMFEIVLIGKDGEIKLRSGSASVAQIFELIDTMPMRRAEMRQKKATDQQEREPE